MRDKILILSDSLALARVEPQKCLYEETWPFLLRSARYNVHQVSIRGATSDILLRQCKYHKAFNPDVVVVQVGIVDCAPRFVSKRERALINRIPLLGSWTLDKLNTPKVREFRSLTYIKTEQFHHNMKGIKSCFNDSVKVLFVEIIGGNGYDSVLPNVIKNINDYNEVLKKIRGTIYIEYKKPDITMSDYHHLNKKGHNLLANKILMNLT